jgi:hypothetical protein
VARVLETEYFDALDGPATFPSSHIS